MVVAITMRASSSTASSGIRAIGKLVKPHSAFVHRVSSWHHHNVLRARGSLSSAKLGNNNSSKKSNNFNKSCTNKNQVMVETRSKETNHENSKPTPNLIPTNKQRSSKRWSSKRRRYYNNHKSKPSFDTVATKGGEPPILIHGSSSASTSTTTTSAQQPGGNSHKNNNKLSILSGRASPFHVSGGTAGSYRLTQVFPILNISALLDPKGYCKRSAYPSGTTTISGGDAAQRLLRGREAVLDVMRQDCVDRQRTQRSGKSSSSSRHRAPPPQPYGLIGHGVPHQLLQNHIDLADALLTHHDNAAECSFNNFQGDLSFNWMRLRSRVGENRACPWPPSPGDKKMNKDDDHPTVTEWEHQMELYLTVMNRLVSTLGLGLWQETPPMTPVTRATPNSIKDDDDDDDDFVLSRSDPFRVTPRHWSVELLRGVAYPPHLVPKDPYMKGEQQQKQEQQRNATPPMVIVEWTPRGGVSAPGHVCVRLQGISSSTDYQLRRKKKVPVTLVFDACFHNHNNADEATNG